MKLKKGLLILATFFCGMAFSQTKLIAFKSHSGSLKNLEIALLNPKFDLVNHNLGMRFEPTIVTAQIDSLIFVSDSQVVMVTSTYCDGKSIFPDINLDQTAGESNRWKPGKDTVINHPLFSKSHRLDSIKHELEYNYNFRNNIDSVVFIGYDNNMNPKINTDRQETSPVITTPEKPSGGKGFGIILFSIILAAGLIGLLSWIVSRRTSKSIITE